MLTAPCPLASHHILAEFSCGETALDLWLRDRALAAEQEGSARTYVICEDGRVVAYYSLAVGSVTRAFAPGGIRRNMPDPVPVMVLARLAVDERAQARGVGRGMVRDAILRTLHAAQIAGIRAMLVHALHERAALFYRQCGFVPSPIAPLVLLLRLPKRQ